MKIFSSLKRHATSFLEPYKQQEPATYAAAEQAIGAVLITDGFIGIDNPFGGKKRPGIFGTLGGIIIGIVFMLTPTFIGNLSGINNMTASTSATVVSVGPSERSSASSNTNSSSTCPMTVHYTVNGKEYTKQSSTSSSSNCSKSEGQAITINYDPNNPASWTADKKSFGLFLQLFFWTGVIAFVSGIVTFIIRLLSIIYGWKILKDGRKLAASLPQSTNLETIINEIKQNFIGKVFNFGGGGAVSMGGIESMVSSMTNPTTQPPAQPAQTAQPPVQPTTPTQQPSAQTPQATPPTPQTETPSSAPPTSEPTDTPGPEEK